MSAPPANHQANGSAPAAPYHQAPSAPPYPGGGVPAANSMYPTVQQGYPGVSYAAQSTLTYNLSGNPPAHGPAHAGPPTGNSPHGGSSAYPSQSAGPSPSLYPNPNPAPYPAAPPAAAYPGALGGSPVPSNGAQPYSGQGMRPNAAASSPYPPPAGNHFPPVPGGPSYPGSTGGGYSGQGSSPYPPQSGGPPPAAAPPFSTHGPSGANPYGNPGGPARVPPKVSQPYPPYGASQPYPHAGHQPPSQPFGGSQSNEFGQSGHGQSKMYQQPGFTAVPQVHAHGDVVPRNLVMPQKKALIVGCNYQRTRDELKGCINDAKCMEYLLATKFGFDKRSIRVLTDDQAGRQRPTKQLIIEGMHWLVEGASPGSSLFFHFSGHGSQKRDYVGDEKDGFNETLLPTDHRTAGQIVDDDINRFLVNSLGPGVTLHAVIDACHSGTAMDLKYNTKFSKKSQAWVWKDNGTTKKYKGTNGGIAFQFGACKDSEVAQDTNDMSGYAHTGAATFAFIQAIELGGPQQSYADILSHMRRCLDGSSSGSVGGLGGMLENFLMSAAAKFVGKSKQTPQLSCSETLNLNERLRI